jgi:hypothetical protein
MEVGEIVRQGYQPIPHLDQQLFSEEVRVMIITLKNDNSREQVVNKTQKKG